MASNPSPRAITAEVSRADLLLIRQTLGASALEQFRFLEGMEREPGARHRPPGGQGAPAADASAGPTGQDATAAGSDDPTPIPTQAVGGLGFYRVVAHRSVEPASAPGQVPDWYREARLLADPDTDAAAEIRPLSPPLIPWRRLWPFLRAALGKTTELAAPDIPRLVKLAALGRLPRRIPRRRHAGWAPRAWLILDLAPRLAPLGRDRTLLLAPLLKLRGTAGLRIFGLPDGPHGHWKEPRGPDQVRELPGPPTPQAGTLVLVLGDLGQYGSGATRAAWAQWGASLLQAGVTPIALAPVPARHRDPGLSGLFRQICWDRDTQLPRSPGAIGPLAGRVAPAHAEVPRQSDDLGAERLLDLVAAAVRMEPALLRQLRLRLPAGDGTLDIGAEFGAWNHADLAWKTLGGEWRDAETVNRRVEGFQARGMAEREVAARLLRVLHRGLVAEVRAEEGANLERLGGASADHERQRLRDTLATMRQGSDHAERIARYARRFGKRQAAAVWQDEAAVALWVAAHRDEIEQGDAAFPPGLEDIRGAYWLLEGDAHPRIRTLVQRGPELFLIENARLDDPIAPSPRRDGQELTGSPLGHLALSQAPVQIANPGSAAAAPSWRSQPSHADRAIPLRAAGLKLLGHDAELTIAALTRPEWARAIGQDGAGLFVDVPDGVPDGDGSRRLRWVPPGPPLGIEVEPWVRTLSIPRGAWWDQDAWRRWRSGETPGADWAERHGVDAIGPWAEFDIDGVTQRMRWIWPGEFSMGSPETELERRNNERQHQVLLTRGYWLADTACTQTMWQAVMGGNPSRFKGPERPVETVSWDQVAEFIQRLNGRIPGLDLRRPSEAEWEYACRAGTTGPFSFGPTITTDQVNFDGDYPYGDDDKGKDRGEILDVKALPGNDWGLYQMHGNVWEWCADWYAGYAEGVGIDPGGAAAGVLRVCRGGGWILRAGDCRSALRFHGQPGYRFANLGFRLARGPVNRPAEPGPEAKGRRQDGRGAGQTQQSGVGQAARAAWRRVRGK